MRVSEFSIIDRVIIVCCRLVVRKRKTVMEDVNVSISVFCDTKTNLDLIAGGWNNVKRLKVAANS